MKVLVTNLRRTGPLAVELRYIANISSYLLYLLLHIQINSFGNVGTLAVDCDVKQLNEKSFSRL